MAVKNDFAVDEDIEECGFNDSATVGGKCVSSFSFENDTQTNQASDNNINTSNNVLFDDNRHTPIANGITPPVDGEYFTVKRSYMLRESTIRKLNQLKGMHPDINTYICTIVDAAINHYFDFVKDNDGKFE